MAQENVDQVAAIKASLELMVAENSEIHEYFRDLLEKVSDLDQQEPQVRREKFRDLMDMGAFRFHGLDIRHFTHSPRKPLSPPLFFSRTKRRLKNTLTLVDEFERRGLFSESEQLRSELDLLASTIVNESSGKEVQGFKSQVDDLRESSLFQGYLEVKNRFIRQDEELRADAEFIAAKESVEEGEELYRQRSEELDALSKDLDSGAVALEEAQARLDAMTLEAADDAEGGPASDEASQFDALVADTSDAQAGGDILDMAPPDAPEDAQPADADAPADEAADPPPEAPADGSEEPAS